MIGFWLCLTVLALLLFGHALHLGFTRARPQDRRFLDPLPSWLRPFWPLVEVMAFWLRPALPEKVLDRLNRVIYQAGWRFWLSPPHLVALCVLAVLAALVLPLLPSLLLARPYPMAFAVLLSLVLSTLPLLLAIRHAQRRASRIRQQLPFFMDLLVLALEGGHPVSVALSMSARLGIPGVLRDELNHVLRDLRAGSSRMQALSDLEQRLELVEISSFVATLALGERHGLRLGPLLRAQADARRNERFVLAEKRALQAPVKMLFPLLFFVFPGTFAILLFPVYAQWVFNGRFL